MSKTDSEFTVDPAEDMNALSDRDLKRRKELMDLAFEKNRVKVGDPQFVYDKQVSRYVLPLHFCGLRNSVKERSRNWPLP